MLYIRPVATFQKMTSSIAHAQYELTADCSGECPEAGYGGYPNYVTCSDQVSSGIEYQFSIFLPGELRSSAEVISACKLYDGQNQIDLSNCDTTGATPQACGDIGYANYFYRCATSGSCPSDGSSITLVCDGYDQGAGCDYDNLN